MAKVRMQKPPQGVLDIDKVTYPCWGQFKLDGFRCSIQDGETCTNTLKPIANRYTRELLEQYAGVLEGFDGELCIGDPAAPECFNLCQSQLTREDGEPDFKFYVFDVIWENAFYSHRHQALKLLAERSQLPDFVVILECVEIRNREELEAFVDLALSLGYEGVILRQPGSLYKNGRATMKKQEVLRIKPMEDAEATIIGFEEEFANLNEAVVDERGLSKRSSHKANKVPKGVLGAFICHSEEFGVIKVNGFDDNFAKYVWEHQEEFLGKTLTYKFQRHGTKDKPRILKFKGIRELVDID